ncbi:MAG: GAF domain-containing protein [Streptosporangiaceae bacterium]|nr:GAF domain-containing protein [Streptosporangiaceae bacterium]
MAMAESRNLPRLQEQVEAVYRGAADRLPPAGGEVLAWRAGHVASFIRFSLDEPEAIGHLQGMAGNLRDASGLDVLLPRVLDGALALTGADFGNVQLVDPVSGGLKIVTQSGFSSEFLGYFALVDDDHSACGRAARHCAQMVITDVTTDPGFAPHREIAAAAGFRAVQSTPLTDSAGRLIGMVSTHFREPGCPPGRDLRILELYGDLAGETVARQLGSPGSGSGAAPGHAGEERDDPRIRPPDLLVTPQTAAAEFAGHIVHRLFAAGLSLASAQAILGKGAAGERVAVAIDELDNAIREIRTEVLRTAPPSDFRAF